jgi:membrane protease YdiL (CAAX protease family)
MSRGLADPPATSLLLFCSVLLSTAGIFSLSSLASNNGSDPATFSSSGLWGLVILEAGLAVFWVTILRTRGWSLACMTVPADPTDLLRALGLVVLSFGLATFTTLATRILFSDPGASAREVSAVGHLSFGAILVASVINPVAEEFLYLGFTFNAARRAGRRFAVVVSVLTRLAVHLYQGPGRLLGIAAMGVLLTVYYSRSGRLWAVVFAHSFLDALGLATVSGHHAPR